MIESSLDFETRSFITNLKQVGPYRYAECETTEAICFSWTYGKDSELYTWYFKEPDKNLGPLKELFQHIKSGGLLRGHNVEFEYAIWNIALERQLKKLKLVRSVPKLDIKQLRCTASEASYLCLPRGLDNLCKALDTEKKKDMRGNAIMKQCSKPRKPTKNNPSIWFEDDERMQATINYNRDDVLAEMSCAEKLLRLPKRELDLFHLTIKMNERGMRIDTELAKKAVEFRKRFELEKHNELKVLTEGRIEKATQTARIKKEIESEGFEIPNLQEETITETLKRKDVPEKVRKLLTFRKILSKSSLAKYNTMLDAVCSDGRVKGCQMYHGATTGRWAGKGMQPHNFPKVTKKEEQKEIERSLELLKLGDYDLFKALHPNVYSALSNCLRSMIIAEKGNTFYDVDWSAIEARIVLWLAGDEEGLQVFRDGRDAYKELAALVFGISVDEVTPWQRQYVGKPGVLGSGFGMGFEKMAAQYDMDLDLAHRTVKAWREKHVKVKEFWGSLHKAACNAVLNPGKVYKAGPRIRFKYFEERKFLIARLPSGRNLFYQKPKVAQVVKRIQVKTPYKLANGETRLHTEQKLIKQKEFRRTVYKGGSGFYQSAHGGLLCENVTQAVARDVLADTMLRLDGTPWAQTLGLHDEIKSEGKKGLAEKKYLELINKKEKWAESLPLKTELWVNERFGSY